MTVTATDTFSATDTVAVTIEVINQDEGAVLNSVRVASITRTSAEATFSLSNGDGVNTTVYVRYRTPSGSGSWLSGGSESTTGTVVATNLAGLQPGTSYRVQGSLSSSFTNTVQRDFTTPVNNAPDFTELLVTREIEENRLAGTNVGVPVTATDADGDPLTYTLDGTDAASFDLDDSTAQITVGSSTFLDYETKASYSVTVTATDTFSATDTVTVTIEVVDVREAGILGRVVFTIGHGSPFGYVSGSYGTLDSGTFPGALFGDGNSRAVDSIYEDDDGYWYFSYSGGLADDWLDDQEALDEILVEVSYEGGADRRVFVLGGFIDSRPGSRVLKLDPPLPSRDWESRDGEEIEIAFRRHSSQAAAALPIPRETKPAGEPGSFIEFLTATTPGGAVTAQMLIVIIVYVTFLYGAPPTPWGIMLSAGVLVLTPWVPMIFGYGDVIAASIILINVILAAYTYQVYAARTQ